MRYHIFTLISFEIDVIHKIKNLQLFAYFISKKLVVYFSEIEERYFNFFFKDKIIFHILNLISIFLLYFLIHLKINVKCRLDYFAEI